MAGAGSTPASATRAGSRSARVRSSAPVPQPTSSTVAGWGIAHSATSALLATTCAWNRERQSCS
jgi:hypothetical protein